MSWELTPYRNDLNTRARGWLNLSEDARKRRAYEAAANLDEHELWDLMEAYLATFGSAGATISPHTLRAYRKSLGVLLAYCRQRGMSLVRPSRDLGTTFVRHLEAEGLSSATVRVRLAAARRLYQALRWAGAASNADPFSDAQPARDATAPWDKRQPYAHDEVAALLAQAGPKDKVLVLLGAHAGLRVEEITRLRWEEIDTAARVLTVRAGKGGKSRRVHLSASLAAALDRLKEGAKDERVLAFTPTRARARLKALARTTHVTYKGVHALRHYAGTRLAKETGDLEHVARHLGHASLEMARVYAKWSDETLQRTVGRW